MRTHLFVSAIGFAFGLIVAYGVLLARPSWVQHISQAPVGPSATPIRPSAAPVIQPKAPERLTPDNIILYCYLHDGVISGKYFNQNADTTVTQITIEAVPKDKDNYFNQFSPHLFNVNVSALPRSMSPEFSVETGRLNPEFHTLRVAEVKGAVK